MGVKSVESVLSLVYDKLIQYPFLFFRIRKSNMLVFSFFLTFDDGLLMRRHDMVSQEQSAMSHTSSYL